MFSEKNVKALLRDRRLTPPVASLYLNTDRTYAEGERYLAALRQVLHEADRLLRFPANPRSATARERLTEVAPQLLVFLDKEVASQSTVRGVAFFVSLAASSETDPRTPTFTAFTLPRPVRSQARVDQRPYIRPLLLLLDQYERVGAIVADRAHARIFTAFLGELEEMVRRTSETPRRHAQGWKQQTFFQRDVDGHTKAHIRSTVREALRLFRARPLKRLILGGSDETLALLTADLPHAFRQMIAGTFPAESHASDRELIAATLALAQRAEQEEEAQRVRELSDALARHAEASWGTARHRAVHGLDETLRALAERRVQLLVVRRGFRAPGGVCDNCAALSAHRATPCPTCRTPLRAVADVVEHAIEHASEERAEVEFVTEDPTLEALGNIGAFLRF